MCPSTSEIGRVPKRPGKRARIAAAYGDVTCILQLQGAIPIDELPLVSGGD
jgi:hypothetical protein